MSTGQSGQAIVGVMVVMIILFALAGAVAIGASTLLAGGRQNAAVASDFQGRSAVNDAAAQVAGSTQACGAPPPISPSPDPSPTATPSPLWLAQPPNGMALCSREDEVRASSLRPIPARTVQDLALPQCATMDLGVVKAGRLAVLFNARATSFNGGAASINTGQGCTSLTDPRYPKPPRAARFPAAVGQANRVVQLALSGDFGDGDHVYLHVSTNQTLGRIFTAAQDPAGSSSTTGALYLVAAPMTAANPDYEEFVFFVSDDGRANRLLYEAPLPS